MSQRKLPPIALFVAAAVVATFGLTGAPHAGAATTATVASKTKAKKPTTAEPNGSKGNYELADLGPKPTDNVALKWSEETLGMIRMSTLPPTAVSRVLAIVQTSVYDAWAAYDPVAVGTQLGSALRRPAAERTLDNKSEAISVAAYRALLNLFPAQEPLLTDFLTALQPGVAKDSTDTTTPAGVGNAAAAAVLDARRNDGSNQYGTPAYADTTGYVPVNTVTTVNDPWHWQPLLVNGKVQKFATPQWGRVRPFALTTADQFPVPGPDMKKDYRDDMRIVVKLSAQLNDEDKVKAEYWADGPSSELPPGHSAIFAGALCRRHGDDLDNDVKLLFLQGNAVLDAGIAAWYNKLKYDFVRPITLVHELYKGEKIRAWGGPNNGTVSMNGEDWRPYQPVTVVTPPFPEYVSGHSTFSGASFEVLRAFTGSNRLDLYVTVPVGKSAIEKGVPAKPVKLGWKTMQDAANESGESREFGGIHFKQGDQDGRALGTKIGQAVFAKAQTYFNGTATP